MIFPFSSKHISCPRYPCWGFTLCFTCMHLSGCQTNWPIEGSIINPRTHTLRWRTKETYKCYQLCHFCFMPNNWKFLARVRKHIITINSNHVFKTLQNIDSLNCNANLSNETQTFTSKSFTCKWIHKLTQTTEVLWEKDCKIMSYDYINAHTFHGV